MRFAAMDPVLSSLLADFGAAGGVLDYVFLDVAGAESQHQRHRTAAAAGMAELDRRTKQWATDHETKELPVDVFFRLRWDEAAMTGGPVSFSTFWGTDDVEPKKVGKDSWSIPTVDGYKPAFFHPPYTLRGSAREKERLFVGINRYVLGPNPAEAEIYSWSTDWSNYFDAGHEWWGAFYWTISKAGSDSMVVVAASSTD